MIKYGLIGYPLSHSFSKTYFSKKFEEEGKINEVYENYPIDNISKLETIINNEPDLVGLNVTIPYKQKVLSYLHTINDVAKEISAVNTIKIDRKDNEIQLSGYNTDVFGFRESLLPYVKPHHKKALVLGTGGASKAIKYVLQKLQIGYVSVSRNPIACNCIGYQEINEQVMEEFGIIINTTPLGTYPNIDSCPELPYHLVTEQHLLYDLVYNPETTLFMEQGQKKGATTVNGLNMLYLQANKSYEIWNS